MPLLNYDQPLFRPPSEANSLILQTTLGCSWNHCAFCEMYTSKKFSARKEADVFGEIDQLGAYDGAIRKVFLADGNAFVLSFNRLKRILDRLNESFPRLLRIATYASPRDILSKTDQELVQLATAGLKLLYVGIESGDDELLRRINKGETAYSTEQALIRARQAGIKLSVMVLNGLGGKMYSKQHAVQSAAVINKIQPEYLSTLVLSFPYGLPHFKSRFDGQFEALSTMELIAEMGHFLNNLELKQSIFRSDHASNYLVLKGILNRDKTELLSRIKLVLSEQDPERLRPDWLRGL